MYVLDNRFTDHEFVITIVGCGGTGAFVADGLCRLFAGSHVKLVLIDYDTVEERNLDRQHFFKEDLDKYKSEALAIRFARLYGLPVGYAISPLQITQICYPGIVIGCVDNGKTRGDIAEKLGAHSPYVGEYERYDVNTRLPVGSTKIWWVDAGNGENYGQILIGNARIGGLDKSFNLETGLCLGLPFPTIQSPDLLVQVPPVIDCAAIAEQEPVINRVMASLTIEVVRRIIDGTCSWMQLWLDLEAGNLTPIYATLEGVAAISKKNPKRLRRKEDNDGGSKTV